MSRTKEQGGESAVSILIGIILLLAGAFAVFYAAYKVSYVSVDYGIHIDIAKELDWSDPVQMLREHPEPAWHLLVRAAMKAGGFSAERAAGIVSGGLCSLTYLLAAHFLYRLAGEAASSGSASSGTRAWSGTRSGRGGLSVPGAALYALVLSLSSAIYVPRFNKTPYLGQGSPNPWHNPTTIIVRPIGLLIFLIVMGECVRAQRAGFGKGNGLRVWKGFLIAVLLLLSNLSKPSFVQIFYPAIFVLMFLWLFIYRGKNFPLGMQLLVCCLPSVALMGMQFLSAFYGNTNSDSAGIVIAPFKVAGLYTDNIAISTLLVLAFPLFIAFCSLVRGAFDWTSAFAWIMLLAGMAEKFLLAEGGSRMAHGNFSWGYILGVYFVWFIGIRDFAVWQKSLSARRDGDGAALRVLSVFALFICGVLLLAHLISGIYYLYYLVVLGNGI
ncbi:MAG: hypothetical protein Q4D81_01645 [Eubacteriales bacterium]|nr:hypothetical protein [Eubacteriales bacterium]